MNHRNFIVKQITRHLTKLGLNQADAEISAEKGADLFASKQAKARDPFRQACDLAGQVAAQRCPSFRYQSPKPPAAASKGKRPQEAPTF